METGRERQLAELAALQEIYGTRVSTDCPITASLLADGDAGFVEPTTTLRFAVELDGGVQLGLELAPLYPAAAALVSLPGASAEVAAELRDRAAIAAAVPEGGDEVIFELCCAAQEALLGAVAGQQRPRGDTGDGRSEPVAASDSVPELKRVFFWAHHIRRKRKGPAWNPPTCTPGSSQITR